MPHTSDSDQALWVAAVLQARADIEDLPIGAMNYQAAVAFFTTEAGVYILATEVSSAEAADMDARCAIPGLSARFAIRGNLMPSAATVLAIRQIV